MLISPCRTKIDVDAISSGTSGWTTTSSGPHVCVDATDHANHGFSYANERRKVTIDYRKIYI